MYYFSACCFFGQSKISEDEYLTIVYKLILQIQALIQRGVFIYITGGDLGFDILAAKIILLFKKQYPEIQLYLFSAYPIESKDLESNDIVNYNLIRAAADQFINLSPFFHTNCQQIRDCQVIDRSSFCICYDSHHSYKTRRIKNYAKKNHVTIIDLTT